jgi:hypothetical protein
VTIRHHTVRTRDWVAPAAAALLIYAGYFKGSPLLAGVPVDLTLLGAVLTACGIAAAILATGRVPRGTGPVLAVWATFIPAALLHAGNAYGEAKTQYLFTLTLLAALAPLFLVRSPRRQQIWVWLQIGLGAVLAVTAWLRPAPSESAADIYRLALQGSNPIGEGRAAGVAVTGCLALAIAGHRRRWWLASAGIAVSVPMFLAGSRGPVLAAAAAVAIGTALAPASGMSRAVRVTLVAAGGAVAWLYISGVSSGPVGRISSTLLEGNDAGTSSQARLEMWRYSWAWIESHALWTGWGSLQDAPGFRLLSGSGLVYPHDLILEVAGEAGWLAALAVIVFIGAALRRLRQTAAEPYGAALFGIAVFFLVNALVSGDINDGRPLWAALAVAWALAPCQRYLGWRAEPAVARDAVAAGATR